MWTAGVLCIMGLGLLVTEASDLVDFSNKCENCIVSNGLGFNSYAGDCSCYWTCVLKRSVKVMSNSGNDWISYKGCCGCDKVWSQKLLTCVGYRSKLSDCFRGHPSLNPCTGMPDGSYLARASQDKVDDTPLCAGYIRCVEMLGFNMPKHECCPAGHCFDSSISGMSLPCSPSACSGECEGVQDCQCQQDEEHETECLYQAVPGNEFQFMGRQNMLTFTCAAGTCWNQEICTCVRTNNTGYNDCIPWVEMDFEDGSVTALSGRGDFMWSESHGVDIVCCGGGAQDTDNYARFDGNDAGINLAALANSHIVELQTLVTNCHDDSGNGFEQPTFDVCVFREDGTGNGLQVSTNVQFNTGWFMLGNSMLNAVIHLETTFMVGVWYEYWLIYCGEDELMYNGILQDGAVVVAKSYPVTDSKFILVSQSGFNFGTSLQSFKSDYNGGIDQVLLFRCKPFGYPDFDADFEAIKTFVEDE